MVTSRGREINQQIKGYFMSGDFCEVCGRVFDLTDEVDAHEFKNGHECDALVFQEAYAVGVFHHGQE